MGTTPEPALNDAPPGTGWEALSPREAVAWQRANAARVRQEPGLRRPAFVAGVDAGFTDQGRQIRAVATLYTFPGLECVAFRVIVRPVRFPYVPGLLSFREAPALLEALAGLPCDPGVVLCDGHGVAHPRRLGVASHIGVVSGLRTIGVAKTLLVGTHAWLPETRGSHVPLLDRGERIGAVVRTRARVRPVYVSVGHRVDLRSATAFVLACSPHWRLPAPVHLADRLSRRAEAGSWSKVNALLTTGQP